MTVEDGVVCRMEARQGEHSSESDPHQLLYEAHQWSRNAADYAEGDENRRAAAAVWAQLANAKAIAALAAAILATHPLDLA
jgi:hypothetical protein